jgi:hypothetical protein
MIKFTKRANAIAAIVLQMNFRVGKAGFDLSDEIHSISSSKKPDALAKKDIELAIQKYEQAIENIRVETEAELDALCELRFDDEVNGSNGRQQKHK